MISVTVDTREFERDLALYAKLARKTMQGAIFKQGAKVVYAWAFGDKAHESGLKGYTPKKGAIREMMLKRLKERTGGIYVRPSAYAAADKQLGNRKGSYTDLVTRRIMRQSRGKTEVVKTNSKGLNRQALAVRSELNMRERARGFSAYGASMLQQNTLGFYARQAEQSKSGGTWDAVFQGKARQDLSLAHLVYNSAVDDASLKLVWGTPETKLGESLTQPGAQKKLQRALYIVHEDMMVYVRDRLAKAAADPNSKYALALRA